jgi:spoIIIJ-associated protein
MIKTLRKSAKTVDEALNLALNELGLTRDDVSMEIVELAKSGFLGIGGSPAVIDVSYEAEDDAEPVGSASETDKAELEPAAGVVPPVEDERTELLREFLGGVISRLGTEGKINFSVKEEDTLEVSIETDDAGAIIGRRGDTLDAIQHLANYVINREGKSHLRVNIDVGDYRKRREEALSTLAAKTAASVVKNRRSVTLDPMNAYERHVIHTALQENGQVSTYSVGSEPRRRVVVAFGKDPDAPRRAEGENRGNRGRDRESAAGTRRYNNRDSEPQRGQRSAAPAPHPRSDDDDEEEKVAAPVDAEDFGGEYASDDADSGYREWK